MKWYFSIIFTISFEYVLCQQFEVTALQKGMIISNPDIIFQDAQYAIWSSTNFSESEAPATLRFPNLDPAIQRLSFKGFAQERNQRIWALSSDGTLFHTGNTHQTLKPYTGPIYSFEAIVEDDKSQVWGINKQGLWEINSKAFRHITKLETKAFHLNLKVNNNTLLIITGHQIWIIEGANLKLFTNLPDTNLEIIDIITYNKNHYITDNKGKLWIWEYHTKKIRQILSTRKEKINSIIEIQGQIWLGIEKKGVFHLSPNHELTKITTTNPLPNDIIFLWKARNGQVIAFYEREAKSFLLKPIINLTKFINTPHISSITYSSEVGTCISQKNNIKCLQLPGYQFKIPEKNIQFLNRWKDGFISIITKWPYDHILINKPHKTEYKPLSGKVFYAKKTYNNHFYALLRRHLIELTRDESFKEHALFAHEDSNDPYPTILEENKKQEIWIGFSNGSIRILQDHKLVRELPTNICGGTINAIAFDDRHGIAWIGTDQGLAEYKIRDQRYVKCWQQQTGLEDRQVTNILVSQEDQTVWITNNKHLYKVNTKLSILEEWFKSPQSSIIENTLIMEAGSHISLATSEGIFRIKTSKIAQLQQNKPRILLKEILVNNNPVPARSFYIFERNENTIKAEVYIDDFGDISDLQYKFELLKDGSLILQTRASSQAFLVLPNLPFGAYSLKVYGKNTSNIWSDHPKEISFEIKRGWWEYPAFPISIGLTILTIVFFISFTIIQKKQAELKAIKAELKAAEAINEAKNQKINHQAMYHHLIENELGSLLFDITSKSIKSLIQVKGRLIKIQKQATLYNLSEPNKTMLISDFYQSITSLLEEQINFPIKLILAPYPLSLDEFITKTQADDLEKIISEIILNSKKHAQCNKIYFKLLHITNNTNYLWTVLIGDNGVGFNRNEITHTGKGLCLLYDICELHKFKIELNTNKGTHFNIKIPPLKHKEN